MGACKLAKGGVDLCGKQKIDESVGFGFCFLCFSESINMYSLTSLFVIPGLTSQMQVYGREKKKNLIVFKDIFNSGTIV